MSDGMAQWATVGLFVCLALLTWRDLTTSIDAQKTTKDIPMPKLSKFTGPTLRFLFWKVYEQFAYAIHQKYPQLNVEGDNFPPPTMRTVLSQVLGIGKFIFIVLIVTGQNPFTWLNTQTPAAYHWAMENKIYACMMLFFISNAIEGQLISTGAFEVVFNDVPVWSKLETGRVPSPQELFQIIENHMRLNQS